MFCDFIGWDLIVHMRCDWLTSNYMYKFIIMHQWWIKSTYNVFCNTQKWMLVLSVKIVFEFVLSLRLGVSLSCIFASSIFTIMCCCCCCFVIIVTVEFRSINHLTLSGIAKLLVFVVGG